jgi:hypothetical protein
MATCGTIQAGRGSESPVVEWIRVLADLIFHGAPDDESVLNIVPFISHLSLARPDLTSPIWTVVLDAIGSKLSSCRLETGDSNVSQLCRVFSSVSTSAPEEFAGFLEGKVPESRESPLVGAILAVLHYTSRAKTFNGAFGPFVEAFAFLLEPAGDRGEAGFILFYFYSVVNEFIRSSAVDVNIRDFIMQSFRSLVTLVTMVDAGEDWCHTFAEICLQLTGQPGLVSWLPPEFAHEIVVLLMQCPLLEVFKVIGHLFHVLTADVQHQLFPVLRESDPHCSLLFLQVPHRTLPERIFQMFLPRYQASTPIMFWRY